MWYNYSRERTWSILPKEMDLVVIGGGITGAGIFREATRLGLNTLLVEKKDFAWGTSSASSKMVHGGLRYLKEGDIGVTLDSVRERKRLLSEAPYLIKPLNYIMPIYKGEWGKKWMIKAGLVIYDLMGKQWIHGQMDHTNLLDIVPYLKSEDLECGIWFQDAITDDARLVLNVIQEGLADGGMALNYCTVQDLHWAKGKITGVSIVNQENLESKTIKAKAIINATGAWAANICDMAGQPLQLRPLRGSHLVFPRELLPTPASITLLHPKDKRPLFVFPWQGRTIVGTTDLDHDQDLNKTPFITQDETNYLFTALNTYFPRQYLTPKELISSFAGVRPIVSHGNRPPSKEPRKHIVKDFCGMITVSGGKLTTFRLIAHDALQAASHYLKKTLNMNNEQPIFTSLTWEPSANKDTHLAPEDLDRLKGRYHLDCPNFFVQAKRDELATSIGDTPYRIAELRWAVAREGVMHLDDLLLRRTRLGLILDRGGLEILELCKNIFQEELNWDNRRWEQEAQHYRTLWDKHFGITSLYSK